MASIGDLPKWASADRRQFLIKLWFVYGNKCLLGHTACPIYSHYIKTEHRIELVARTKKQACQDRDGNPIRDSQGNQLYYPANVLVPVKVETKRISRLYEDRTEPLIDTWKQADIEQRRYEWEAEQRALHYLNEPRLPIAGRFSGISRAIFHDNQPLYYLEALGISGITLEPFAKVRIPSSYMRLYVSLGDTLRGISKNKRRKAIRYGKPLPQSIENSVNSLVYEAVKHYLAH